MTCRSVGGIVDVTSASRMRWSRRRRDDSPKKSRSRIGRLTVSVTLHSRSGADRPISGVYGVDVQRDAENIVTPGMPDARPHMSPSTQPDLSAPELYVLTLPLGWRRPPGWHRAFRPATGDDVTAQMVERATPVLDQFAHAAADRVLTEDECKRWARSVLTAAFDDRAPAWRERDRPSANSGPLNLARVEHSSG